MPQRTAGAAFHKETLRFLVELEANNEREWFQANKHRYERWVLAPALAFIEAMAPRIERLSKHLLAAPKRTGGSLMRIYRDTRFASDKTPYKTNIGIQFRHVRGRDVHAPGLYVHIEPDGCFLGAGIWHPEAEPLHKIRTRIAERPDAWRRASRIKGFTERFALAGEQLSRPPRGFAATAAHVEDLKRKDFIAISRFHEREALGAGFAGEVAARFKTAGPLMSFLCAALELPY